MSQISLKDFDNKDKQALGFIDDYSHGKLNKPDLRNFNELLLKIYGNEKEKSQKLPVLYKFYNSFEGQKYSEERQASIHKFANMDYEDGVTNIPEPKPKERIFRYSNEKEISALGADKNIINEENRMSDEIEKEEKARDPKETAFFAALHQRKVIVEAAKAGNLVCLPRADGYADTTPAKNLINGTAYHGNNLLFLKELTREKGYPTAEFVTSDQIQKAREEGHKGIAIREGEKGVSISVSERIKETDDWETKSYRLFNVAQSYKPAELKAYAEAKQEQFFAKKEARLQQDYGTSFRLEKKEQKPGLDIECSSTEPEKYLGEYLAAVSMNSKFKVSPEQANEFAQKLEERLFTKKENEHTNPFELSKISNSASKLCKEVIKEARIVEKQIEQPQQEQKQTQAQKRSM